MPSARRVPCRTSQKITDACAPRARYLRCPLFSGCCTHGVPDREGRRRLFGLSPHTLYVWRHRRQGPPSFRMGTRGRVMYRLEALDAWVREQEQADSRSNPALNPLNAPPQERLTRLLSA
ncbi:helix-turn-helix domain-containing protein [Streptomyces sp. NPDC046887]|uniref:helix-turn-helix transcriptional regulator n=1 Tax=Streptomyces sp. NPDC046887 TaxID=3155472 RepID=UPI0033D9426E